MNPKKHIILIDDEPVIHTSFEILLFDTNYRKTSIIDIDEADLYAKNKDKYDKPDLLIIDFKIGKVSGIDVIRSIRQDKYFDDIPIILYTGHLEAIINKNEMMEQLGIAHVLPKVISKKQLLPIIDSLVN